jgi:hypothetical protein
MNDSSGERVDRRFARRADPLPLVLHPLVVHVKRGQQAVVRVRLAVRSRSAIVAAAALAAVFLTNVSAATLAAPNLRSVAASRGHVVAVFTLGSADTEELAPKYIAIAVRPAVQADGSFVPANVRVKESLTSATRVANGMRVRTLHKLRPGRYYVKVSGTVIALDCTPKLPCKELWSNARRVLIPRP